MTRFLYDIAGALKQRVGYGGMEADGRAVINRLEAMAGDDFSQALLARNDLLGKVTGTDKVWDNIDFATCCLRERLAKIMFFFSKGDVNFGEEVAATNFPACW